MKLSAKTPLQWIDADGHTQTAHFLPHGKSSVTIQLSTDGYQRTVSRKNAEAFVNYVFDNNSAHWWTAKAYKPRPQFQYFRGVCPSGRHHISHT